MIIKKKFANGWYIAKSKGVYHLAMPDIVQYEWILGQGVSFIHDLPPDGGAYKYIVHNLKRFEEVQAKGLLSPWGLVGCFEDKRPAPLA